MAISRISNYCLWSNLLLSAYLWTIDLVPLGNWNFKTEPYLLATIFTFRHIDFGDLIFLSIISLPAILCAVAYYLKNKWIYTITLIFNLIWFLLQFISWWTPYIFGTQKKWQLAYSKGMTTKLLPSFGNHVAPDGMHIVISALLILAIYLLIRLMFTKQAITSNFK